MRSVLKSKSFSQITILSGLFLLLTTFIHGAPGDLDPTFGSGGEVITNTGSWDYAHAMAIQTDGKVVVAGYGLLPLTDTCLVIRYNPNGTLDTSFDNDGIAFLPSFRGVAEDVAIQPDGKIVIVGRGYQEGSFVPRFTVGRLNADGSLDTSFDADGIVKTPIGAGAAYPFAVGIQTDGKIVVGGSSYNGSDSDLTAARYNPDGSLDTSFDGDGIVINTLEGYDDRAYALKIQPDGKIVLAGQRFFFNTWSDFGLIRYKSDGTLDTSFDGDGIVTTSIGTDLLDDLRALVLQPDGKIIAGGASIAGTKYVFTAVRYNPDGSLDNSFDNDGIVTTQVGNGSVQVYDLGLQQNGKIVLAGWTFTGQSDDFTVVRYQSDGSLDTGFGNGGIVTTSIGNGNDKAYGMGIQPDGKIVVAGWTHNGVDYDFGLARYEGDPVAPRRVPFDFDGDSKTDISIFRPVVGEWWYLKSSNGGNAALQFGSSADKLAPGDFTGDGKTDIAFWRPLTGEWFILRSENNSFYSFPFGTTGDIPAPSDFDGDDRTDAAVFRPSTATWYVLNSGGGTSIVNFGAPEDKPVPADFDGDGKTNIAIFRPGDGSWWYLQSSDSQYKVYRFGVGTDKPVQGDYTGDGKADLAVFRPSSGEWFVQRSEDGSYFSLPFGAPGDIAVPGDYDGDGKFDTSVFRPSNSTWFMNQTTAGIGIVTFGTTGDTPVPNAFVP
jgi:uncharacterized delta-60 repeat protein